MQSLSDSDYSVKYSSASHPNKMLLSTNSNFEASEVPMKSKIADLIEFINQLKTEVTEGVKQTQMLRSDCYSMEHVLKNMCNNVAEQSVKGIAKVEKGLKVNSKELDNESFLIQKNSDELDMEKSKIQEATLILETRVRDTEHLIGINVARPLSEPIL